MDKNFDVLFEENKERGTKVMKNLDTGITIAFVSIVLNIYAIIGLLCLLFLDIAPVLRIIWEIILFAYFGVLLVEAIINLVRVLKVKHRVKMTNQTIEIIHNILDDGTNKDT